jgi:hypothetical protein
MSSKAAWRHVYYLYFESGRLAYVGSTINPEERKTAHRFGKRLKLTMRLGKYLPRAKALALELREIEKLNPPLNKRLVANTTAMEGRKHTPETIEKMRKAHSHSRPASFGPAVSRALKGRALSSEHRLAISRAKLASPPSKKARATYGRRMSVVNKGRKFTEKHKARISVALQGKAKSKQHRENLSASIRKAYARRRAMGLPTGAAMRSQSWRDRLVLGLEATKAGQSLAV